MGTNIGQVMTLANSIIGVSVLAMPYCFKQCGILLSVLLLCLSSILSRLACGFLLKAAIITRRRNYEFLAFHVFGSSGKLCVELAIIGFLLGTCIAFFVVLGDLGPAISISMFGLRHSDTLRSTILIGVAVVVVLPLGLLRNVDSLSSLCTATIAFYLCLVLKVMGEAAIPLMVGDWVSQLNFWRPEGVLQCLPIFSMALFCQTQLFEIFDSVPNAALDKMDSVVRVSVNMCTAVYVSVGFFGYVAFSKENITGNILVSLSESMSSEVIKLGFFLSVAASFPLVIFPCRASLYSLLYRNAQPPVHDIGATHVPEGRFKFLTLVIVGLSVTVGLFLPNIEHVLGIVGSTIGVTICIIIPALLLMNTARHPKDKLSAQIILWTGAIIMILGTYAHILNSEQLHPAEPDISEVSNRFIDHLNEPPMEHLQKFDGQLLNVPKEANEKTARKDLENLKVASVSPAVLEMAVHQHNEEGNALSSKTDDKRHEPPVPVETAEKLSDLSLPSGDKKEGIAPVLQKEKDGEKRQEPPVPVESWQKEKDIPPLSAEPKQLVREEAKLAQKSGADRGGVGSRKLPLESVKEGNTIVGIEPMDSILAAPEKNNAAKLVIDDQRKGKENASELKKTDVVGSNGGEQVNQDAIRHEDTEVALEAKKAEAIADGKISEDKEASDAKKKAEEQDLLKTLKEHQEVQRDMLNEQQKILQELKKHELGHQASKENADELQKIGSLGLHSLKRLNNSNMRSNVVNTKENRVKPQQQSQFANIDQQGNHIAPEESLQKNAAPVKQVPAHSNQGNNKPQERLSDTNKFLKKPIIMPLPLAYKVSSSQLPPRQPAGRDILESQTHLEREKREADGKTDIDYERGTGLGPLLEEHQHVAGALDKDNQEKECSLKPKSNIYKDENSVLSNLIDTVVPSNSPNLPSILKSDNVDSEKAKTFSSTLKIDPSQHLAASERTVKQTSKSKELSPIMELKTPSSISEPRVEINQNLGGYGNVVSLASGSPTKNSGPKPAENSN